LFQNRFIHTTESRANNLDALRFVLACVVIHSHSYLLTGHDYHSLRAKAMHLQIGGGWLAVDFFFMLSGFLVCNSWLHCRGLGDYLKRRTLRIYPGFVAALAFCVFIVGPLGGADLARYFRNGQTWAYFRPLLLGPLGNLPGVFANAPWAGQVNVPLWTIRFEFICYLVLAAMGLAGLLRRRRIVLAMFLVMAAGYAAQLHGWPQPWPATAPYFGAVDEFPRFIVFFLAGAAFYLYREHIPQSGLLAMLALCGVALGAATGTTQIALPFCGAYLIFYLAFHRTLRVHHFARRGDFSYGMYLYGFPVQQLLVRYLPAANHPLILTMLSLVGALLLAALSWHGVEKPFLKLKRKSVEGPVGVRARSEEWDSGVQHLEKCRAGLAKPHAREPEGVSVLT